MKQFLLAGTAFLVLAASDPVARAAPIDFTYTGSLVNFTVPITDVYQILVFGAQGGDSGTLIFTTGQTTARPWRGSDALHRRKHGDGP